MGVDRGTEPDIRVVSADKNSRSCVADLQMDNVDVDDTDTVALCTPLMDVDYCNGHTADCMDKQQTDAAFPSSMLTNVKILRREHTIEEASTEDTAGETSNDAAMAATEHLKSQLSISATVLGQRQKAEKNSRRSTADQHEAAADSSKRRQGSESSSRRNDRKNEWEGSGWHDEEWEWEWKHYIIVTESKIHVELRECQVSDADLPSLFDALEPLCRRNQDHRGRRDKVIVNIDLSCNLFVTDAGVINHLVPFLDRWPACNRLKLYKTAIGDKALDALAPWISRGYVHELHLSDLRRHVSGDAISRMLKQVHNAGNYPYVNSDGAKCALWLRLEHNGIKKPDQVVSRSKAGGLDLAIIERNELSVVRPGSGAKNQMKAFNKGQKKAAAVHLVLFQMQEVRQPKLPEGEDKAAKRDSAASQSTRKESTASRKDSSTVGRTSTGDVSAWSTEDAEWNTWNAHESWKDPRWDAAESKRERRKRGKGDQLEQMWPEQFGPADAKGWNGMWFQMGAEESVASALEILGSIDPRVRKADPEAFARWHLHLQWSPDPPAQAMRIVKMVGKLWSQGYNAEEEPPSPPVTSPKLPPPSPKLPPPSQEDPIIRSAAGLLSELMATMDSDKSEGQSSVTRLPSSSSESSSFPKPSFPTLLDTPPPPPPPSQPFVFKAPIAPFPKPAAVAQVRETGVAEKKEKKGKNKMGKISTGIAEADNVAAAK